MVFHNLRPRLTRTSNPTVFNNSEDSDVLLRCGDREIFAHRAFLRAWSPFFSRSFSSKFSVARSPIFVIDPHDSGDYEALCAVLKHIYGMPLTEHPDNNFMDSIERQDRFGFYVKIYTVADKYDFPSVRLAVIDNLREHSNNGELNEQVFPSMAEQIADLCGPNAPQLADPALRNFLFEWIIEHIDYVIDNYIFSGKLEEGLLLDPELTTRLVFRLGAQIRDMVRAGKNRKT